MTKAAEALRTAREALTMIRDDCDSLTERETRRIAETGLAAIDPLAADADALRLAAMAKSLAREWAHSFPDDAAPKSTAKQHEDFISKRGRFYAAIDQLAALARPAPAVLDGHLIEPAKSSSAAQPDEAQERAAFEAWRLTPHPSLDMSRNMPDGSYNNPQTHDQWGAWLARASLAPRAQADEDAARLEWLRDTLFSHHWNGVIGPGWRVDWKIVPHHRHIRLFNESGNAGGDFRVAIDAACAQQGDNQGGGQTPLGVTRPACPSCRSPAPSCPRRVEPGRPWCG